MCPERISAGYPIRISSSESEVYGLFKSHWGARRRFTDPGGLASDSPPDRRPDMVCPPDVVQTHFVNSSVRFAVPLIARTAGARRIVTLVRNRPYLKKAAWGRLTYRFYHWVLAVSDDIAEDLRHGGVDPKIVSTHYQGLFGEREKSEILRSQFRKEFGIPGQSVVLAIIAFDAPFKAIDVLLKALAGIVGIHPSVHLIVIGVDPKSSDLGRQAADLGLWGSVHWAGIRDEGWKILNAADIYVQPSRHSEGLPLAVVEAMALKLPVVATELGGIREAVIDKKTGYLAEPDNVESLANALMPLLVDPVRRQAMGQEGYSRYLRLFRGENSVKVLVEHYFGLL
jgi:glycosyltransferase involved in cell wall biosynthesis